MLKNFIYVNGLKEADVIIAKKKMLGVFDHFIIYMGFKYGQHTFIANDAKGGVKWFSEKEILLLVADFVPVKIRRFSGTEVQRALALKRAQEELGKTYDLIDFNCEHLANYVQYGRRFSSQVQSWKTGLAIVSGLLLAAILFKE